MCGEVDEDGPSELEERLYLRFLNHARTLLAQYGNVPQESGGNLHAYMDKLFTDALSIIQDDYVEQPEAKSRHC